MISEAETRRQLAKIVDRAAWLTAELHCVEGQRDQLVRELLDLEGAHDRRPVAVR